MTIKHELNQQDAIIEQIISQLDLSGMTQEKLFGQDGIIKNLTSRLLNRILEAEMDVHLGYKKHSNSGNSRNGYSKRLPLFNDQIISPEYAIISADFMIFSPLLKVLKTH